MSQWTHVAGLIRLDNFGGVLMIERAPFDKQKKVIKAIHAALGNTCTFESSSEETEACTVPCGRS
jgi:hypothetical protein